MFIKSIHLLLSMCYFVMFMNSTRVKWFIWLESNLNLIKLKKRCWVVFCSSSLVRWRAGYPRVRGSLWTPRSDHMLLQNSGLWGPKCLLLPSHQQSRWEVPFSSCYCFKLWLQVLLSYFSVHINACAHSHCSASPAATGRAAAPSERVTRCLETPVLAHTNTSRWLTSASVSTLNDHVDVLTLQRLTWSDVEMLSVLLQI